MITKDKALGYIRTWWRPLTCVWLSATMLVHGVFIPLFSLFVFKKTDTDLNALSLLVGATAAAFAVREWGKAQGNDKQTD